ncbi:hypothetical protein BGZ76_010526 [Entomortierella beljakovae]|nr:hypothetical protein BGZ76_010526 [Entomortierella beljakovae]
MDEDILSQGPRPQLGISPSTAIPSDPPTTQDEPSQESQIEDASSKRTLSQVDSPPNEPSASIPPFPQSSESSQSLQEGHDNSTREDSPTSSSKKRRISLPGKSILKSGNQDDDETDHTNSHERADNQTTENKDVVASENTETFSSTTEFTKRSRKSIGRRVSFAATAKIRMFERDEKEDELPKTMSFLEGLNPKINLNTPFLFESGPSGNQLAENFNNTNDDNDTDNTNNTNNTSHTNDTNANADIVHEQGEHTQLSVGSSDSEMERSFEVNIYSSNSDSTGSSAAGTQLFLPSSDLGSDGNTPFDDGDIGNGSSSEDDSNFFPDSNLMKRSSGIGLHQEGDRDDMLGPQIALSQTEVNRSIRESVNLDEGTQDYSMDYRFLKHRSSIPERLNSPLLRRDENEAASGNTNQSQEYHYEDQIDIGTKEFTIPTAGIDDLSNDPSNEVTNPLVKHDDLSRDMLSIGNDVGMSIVDVLGEVDRSILDEDTDMDITAPIGGIQQIAQELPPTAFHNAEDNTAMFSDFGTPMDITQPFGAGILEARNEPAAPENVTETGQRYETSVPTTPVKSAQSSISQNYSTGDKAFGSHQRDEIQQQKSEVMHVDSSQIGTSHVESSQIESSQINSSQVDPQTGISGSDQPSAPSTPPRRSSSYRGDNLSPSSYPRRSLGTPGRFTPSVQARANIFPEVLEKQLQTLESSTAREPIFRASHVSPETSNLAKRIYRYSVGASSKTTSFVERLERDQNDTMDYTSFGKRLSLPENFGSNDPFSHNTEPLDEDMTDNYAENNLANEADLQNTTDFTSESFRPVLPERDDDDSYTDLPPITLSKFMSLVGISFLDHLNASTRRRTIPHRAGDAGTSTETYRSADLVKAAAISMQELHVYRDACRLLKQSIDTSRAFADDQERKVAKGNPEYFREFRESNADTRDFMKDRFKMIKVHSKLETNAAFSHWKADLLKSEQEILEQHLEQLNKDTANLESMGSTLASEKIKVLPRRDGLKKELEQATERQKSYELCDKEQLASLAEAAEEQGAQIEYYESVKEKKAKELAEIRARVEQLSLTEKAAKARISEAEKTIQKHQYVRVEDLNRAQDTLSIIKAIHLWEPAKPINSPSTAALLRGNKLLEFIYDKTLRVSIDVGKIGKEADAVQVSGIEDENEMDFDLSLVDRQRLAITALAPRKRKPVKEYLGLLRDYTTMIAAKYNVGVSISKILGDISQFWTRVCLIHRDIELIRTHHVVDLVAGSAENLKELELNNGNNNSNNKNNKKVAGSTTPLVVLDIRVRFTGPLMGPRRSARQKSQGDQEMEDADNSGNPPNRRNNRNGGSSSVSEPVKFYLWFTFTLNDVLNFPGANSFTWRLELVYGNISDEHVAQAIGSVAKKGGYDMLHEACVNVNQLLKI